MDGITARLSGVDSEDARNLDRVCREVAAELLAADTPPPFSLTSANLTDDPFVICAYHYWRLRVLDLPSVRTAAACARWLHDHVPEMDESGRSLRAVIEEAWVLTFSSETRHVVDSAYDLSTALPDLVESREIAYFASVYQAGKHYANHKYDQLYDFLETSLLAQAAGHLRTSPLVTALRAFAAYSSRRITQEHARDLLDHAWYSGQRTIHTTDVCLQALATAPPFEGQGPLLRDRASEATAEWPEQHIFMYHFARGLRMCREYDEAIEAMDLALALLSAAESAGISATNPDNGTERQKYLNRHELYREDRDEFHREWRALAKEKHSAEVAEGWFLKNKKEVEEAEERIEKGRNAVLLYAPPVFILFAVVLVILGPSVDPSSTLGERLALMVGHGAVLIGVVCAILCVMVSILRREQRR